MICSGAMVFFDSCSQISFASDEIRCMNSARRRTTRQGPRGARARENGRDFTYTALDDKVPRLLRASYLARKQLYARVVNMCARAADTRQGTHPGSFS